MDGINSGDHPCRLFLENRNVNIRFSIIDRFLKHPVCLGNSLKARKDLVQQMTANPGFFQGHSSAAPQFEKAVRKAGIPNR
jgi:hypothetical protein